MTYQEFAPAAALHPWIASYWRFALPASAEPVQTIHTVPPDGTISLCWLPTGHAVLVGPRMTALRVPVVTGNEYLGVRVLPGVAGPLLGVDARSVRDRVVAFGRAEFSETMRRDGLAGLDELMLNWAAKAGSESLDSAVMALTQRILASNGAAPIAEVAAGLNLSYRQLLRRFYAASGLTPKEFARLRRLRAACMEAVQSADPEWADLSFAAGFADQSHLMREFRDIYGWPPRLVHEYLRRIDHDIRSTA